jgi:coproporphyrinogen III oxidase
MRSDAQLIESLAQQIAEYLERNTQAADGAEGIARWWLRDPQEGKTLERVQAALDLLETRGVVVSNVLKDGHVIYRLAPG